MRRGFEEVAKTAAKWDLDSEEGYERRPYFQDPSRTTTSEFFQVRYTDYDGSPRTRQTLRRGAAVVKQGFYCKWHMCWKRASGKWWPYVPNQEIHSIDDYLAELDADPQHCFFG